MPLLDADRLGWVCGLPLSGCLLCGRSADRHCHADITADLHSDAHVRSQRNTHGNGNLNCHPNADLHGDKHSDLYSIPNRHTYCDIHLYLHPDEYGYRDGNANKHTLAHANFHCDLYVDIDFDEHNHGDRHYDSHCNAFPNPDFLGHVDVHAFCNKYRHLHTSPNIHPDRNVHYHGN